MGSFPQLESHGEDFNLMDKTSGGANFRRLPLEAFSPMPKQACVPKASKILTQALHVACPYPTFLLTLQQLHL